LPASAKREDRPCGYLILYTGDNKRNTMINIFKDVPFFFVFSSTYLSVETIKKLSLKGS